MKVQIYSLLFNRVLFLISTRWWTTCWLRWAGGSVSFSTAPETPCTCTCQVSVRFRTTFLFFKPFLTCHFSLSFTRGQVWSSGRRLSRFGAISGFCESLSIRVCFRTGWPALHPRWEVLNCLEKKSKPVCMCIYLYMCIYIYKGFAWGSVSFAFRSVL